MTQPLPLALIAAVARNGVIGADDALPWRLPSELKHFRATTMGKPVLMGRKTFLSIGRPLPGRFLIVLSRDPVFHPEGIETATTVPEAIERASRIGREKDAGEIMVAGGGVLYEATIGQASRLYLTEVDLEPPGDTYFPAVDPALWRERSRNGPQRGDKDAATFSTVIYERA